MRKGRIPKPSAALPEREARQLGEVGRSAVRRGDLKAAEAAYSQAIALGTRDPDVYNNLATIYDKWGVKQEQELDLLCTAHELAPNSQEIRKNLLNLLRREEAVLVKKERYREALPLSLRRVAIEPESAAAHR